MDPSAGGASFSRRSARNNRALRRFNPTASLAKHIRPINVHLERANTDIEIPTLPRVMRKTALTSFVDGKQIVEQLPMELSLKERLPDNRVPLVMPRECSVRCGEMQLRRRRGTQIAKTVRELNGEEIEIIERIPSAIPVDFSNLHCEVKRCLTSGLLPFSSLSSLAHHLAIQHQLNYADESLIKDSANKPFIKCFLCDSPPFKELGDLQKHFNAAHSMVRQEHNRFRMDQANADQSSKCKPDPYPYSFRSLSPISLPEEEEKEGREGGGEGGGEEEEEEELADEEKEVEEEEAAEEMATEKSSQSIPTKRKCIRRPILFTPISKDEEKQQHIEAALALRDWIQSGGGHSSYCERGRGTTNNGEGSGGRQRKAKSESPFAEMPLLQTEISTGSAGFIDEEEARKIDQLLNSKANNDEKSGKSLSSYGGNGDECEKGKQNNGEVIQRSDANSQNSTREKRSRKPNRRFFNPMEENESEKSVYSRQNVKNKSETPTGEPTPRSSNNNSGNRSKECTPSSSLKKRKLNINNHGKAKKKKLMEMIRTKNEANQWEKMQEKDINSKEGTPHRSASRAADFLTPHSQIPAVKDFVLPESIARKPKTKTKKLAANNKKLAKNIKGPKSKRFLNDAEQATVLTSAETEHLSNFRTENNGMNDGMVKTEERDNECPPNLEGQPESAESTPPPPTQLLTKQLLPTMVTGKNAEDLVFYTPNAKKLREEEFRRQTIAGSSRRKQNLNAIDFETGGLSMLGGAGSARGKEKGQQVKVSDSDVKLPPPKPRDLAQLPVYLTEKQRDLFFKPLKSLFNTNLIEDGFWQCGECGETLKCVKDGRRHMVSHIRVMRMRCSLCDAGAFFCSDMRVHLMYRHCEKLNLAPEEFIRPGIPCMDKEKADLLTQLVDPYNPGRVMYTTGKIVSWTNPKAYFPDPKIERNILGPVLPGYSLCSSPRKQSKASILGRKVGSLKLWKAESTEVTAASTSSAGQNPEQQTEEAPVLSIPDEKEMEESDDVDQQQSLSAVIDHGDAAAPIMAVQQPTEMTNTSVEATQQQQLQAVTETKQQPQKTEVAENNTTQSCDRDE